MAVCFFRDIRSRRFTWLIERSIKKAIVWHFVHNMSKKIRIILLYRHNILKYI